MPNETEKWEHGTHPGSAKNVRMNEKDAESSDSAEKLQRNEKDAENSPSHHRHQPRPRLVIQVIGTLPLQDHRREMSMPGLQVTEVFLWLLL